MIRPEMKFATFVLRTTCTRTAGMYLRNVRVENSMRVRTAFAVAALLTAGLAGCASDLALNQKRSSVDATTYGMFTGEFVDGLPLYRFPPIVVVGSRSSIRQAEMADHDN